MRLPGLLISIFVALAAAAPAQGGREVPPDRPNSGVLDLPDRPQQEEPAQDEDEPTPPPAPEVWVSSFWGETPNRAERVFVDLEAADADDALDADLMRRSLEALQGMGLRTRDTALRALESPHMPSVTLAAQLLRSVGDREKDDARLLVEVASGVGNVAVAGECLDAALVISGGLPGRTVDLVGHPRRNLRSLAEGRLRANPDPEFVPGLIRYLEHGRDADVRTRAARLLGDYTEVAEARDALREAVGDESVKVAFTAAEALAGEATEAERDYLRARIDELETGPELAYLLYALLRQQESAGELLVDAALAERLRPLLSVRDHFLSGAAAAVIAEHVYRSDIEKDLEELQRNLPRVLVRAVGGVEFYPQYARFSPLAEQSLRRISGQDFPERDRRAWVEWYAANRDSITLVRGRMDLDPEDLPSLAVRWFDADTPPRGLAGLAAPGVDVGASGRLLGAQGVKRLEELLRGTAVLDASVLPGTYGLPEDPIRVGVEVRVGARRKPMRFRGASGTGWLPNLLKGFDAMYRGQGWQVLGSGPDAAAFLAEAVPQWDGADEAQRARLLAGWHGERVSALSAEELDTLSAWLLEHDAYAQGWPLDNARLALARLPEYRAAPEHAERVLDAALLHHGVDAGPVLVEACMRLEQPRRSELMARGFQALGASAAIAALEDERLAVQVAAVRSLADAGPEVVPVLLELLPAGDPLVVRVALESLGEIADPRALPAVQQLAAPGQPRELRRSAVAALGGFGEAIDLDLLLAAAQDQDVALRLAALDALRRIPGGEADAAFGLILPRYVGTTLESSFVHAVEMRGAALARTVFRRYLDDANPAVARRSAIHAGRLGEPAAVPALLERLPVSPTDRELLQALAQSTCADYRTMPDPAGIYEVWWRDHQRDDPSLWLVDALEGRGFALSEHFVEGSGASRETIVRDLLVVLETGPKHLRAAVCVHLTALTGIDQRAMSVGLPLAVVQEAAQPWRDWLAGR